MSSWYQLICPLWVKSGSRRNQISGMTGVIAEIAEAAAPCARLVAATRAVVKMLQRPPIQSVVLTMLAWEFGYLLV